jgi:hypothetical protein
VIDAQVVMSLGDRLEVRTPDTLLALKIGQHDQVRQAFKAWVEEKRDSLLELFSESGARYYLPASRILEVAYSTTESRRAIWELEAACREEDRVNRVAVGLPPEEEF